MGNLNCRIYIFKNFTTMCPKITKKSDLYSKKYREPFFIFADSLKNNQSNDVVTCDSTE